MVVISSTKWPLRTGTKLHRDLNIIIYAHTITQEDKSKLSLTVIAVGDHQDEPTQPVVQDLPAPASLDSKLDQESSTPEAEVVPNKIMADVDDCKPMPAVKLVAVKVEDEQEEVKKKASPNKRSAAKRPKLEDDE